MPRGPRLDAPGVVHHVTLRGVGGRDLFVDDADRENFCARLDRLIPELGFTCLAFALMPNHVHLIVRSGRVRISRLMSRLCTGYALYFGKRHGWVGHVLQNRFGSSRIGDDAYLRAAIAYVHRNPLEAGLVSRAGHERYPWTSHSAALGLREPRRFEYVRETLAPFHGDPRELVAAVARSVDLPADLQWRKLPTRSARVTARATVSGRTFDALLIVVCESEGVSRERLLSRARSRQVAGARARVAWEATRQLGVSQARVARELGITPGAVAQMVARAERSLLKF